MIVMMTGLVFITLTTDAKGAEKAKIVLATGNWEPYYGETLPNGGIVTEIVRRAFRRVGYELEVKWRPWARAMEVTKQGKYRLGQKELSENEKITTAYTRTAIAPSRALCPKLRKKGHL